MRRGIWVITLIVGMLLLFPMVSSEILLSQTNRVYSIGEELSIGITLKPGVAVNDFLKVNIVCVDQSIEIHKNANSINQGDEKEVIVNFDLSKSLIGSLIGTCRVEAVFGGENANSDSFEISTFINIDLNLDTKEFNPGERIGISGIAIKDNGEKVDGFIEVSIDSLELKTSKTVNDGYFSFNFTLPDSSESGEHVINIHVYEKESNEVISNEGRITENIDIEQVLEGIEIKLGTQTIFPGNDLIFNIIPYDQGGFVVEREIGLILFEPNDFVYLKKVVISDEEIKIPITLNNTPGYWKIEVTAGDFSERKLFYVEEHEEVLFSLINNTIIITNIGNVPYEKNVEIGIGSATELKQIYLKVGETKKFSLKAPDGDYLIKTNDGKNEVALGNTFLTGRAIGVGEIGEGFFSNIYYVIITILTIVILILLIIYYFVKRKGKISEPVKELHSVSDVTKSGVLESVIANGKKEQASVIALRLNKEIEIHSSPVLNKALSEAKKSGARVYIDNKFRIIIYSPMVTNKLENEKLAVSDSKKLENILRGKLGFGMGINNGEIISEIKDKKFKFTSVGNIITNAKKIATSAKNKTLVSESVHRKILGSVKTKKVEGEKAWGVGQIPDRDKHKDFVNKFKKK